MLLSFCRLPALAPMIQGIGEGHKPAAGSRRRSTRHHSNRPLPDKVEPLPFGQTTKRLTLVTEQYPGG